MKKGKRIVWLTGALWFFLLVAMIIQIAVLAFDYMQARTQNKGLIALLMLAVIVALSALCTLIDALRRKYTVDKPVARILAATERIAKGDFTTRLEIVHPYGKYNQYDVIMENLNTMAAELSKSEVLKSDFISNVSHELRTPLTVMRNYAALLQKEELDDKTREKYAAEIVRATGKLNDVITDVLRLNKLENQEIKPTYEVIDLAATVGDSVLRFEERMEEKGITLRCDLEENVYVSSVKSYIELVCNNLLSNAVKFTDAGGMVEVSVKKQEDLAVIRVSDTGVGISKETGARIFEKFYQGDASRADEGNGLGLALVKKVIDLLGGELSVESELLKGTTFTVALKRI